MSLPQQSIELLSPARDIEIGKQAILHGADAVYIGGPSFGARHQAANDMLSIAQLVEFAHAYHAKIFLALNTILYDEELEQAQILIRQAYDAGVDALIIQDMGILHLDIPDIQLHASTQCDIRTPEKAQFLQNVGFSQLVLARELNLQQIQSIAQAIDPAQCALEFFVHGALCVAYSGQCYISHAQTGRSANRGDCSQACRLPYDLIDEDGKRIAYQQHVLSLKDNDQSAHIEALIKAGIRSFKIEGRYKDMAYVKNMTAHYRRLIDQYIEKNPLMQAASHGQTRLSFTPHPEQNFNRGLTDYFIQERKDNIGAFETPKHAGILIGWIDKVEKESLELIVKEPLSNADGLTYIDIHHHLQGISLNEVQCIQTQVDVDWKHIFDENVSLSRWRVWPQISAQSSSFDPEKIKALTPVKRNRDMNWLRLLEKKSSTRLIAITIDIEMKSSEALDDDTLCRFVIHARDAYGHHAELLCSINELQKSHDKQKTKEAITAALSKWGDTIFEVQSVHIPNDWSWFIPISQWNHYRRELVQALQQKRQGSYIRPSRNKAAEPLALYPEQHLSYLGNVLNQKALQFYQQHGVKVCEPAYEAQAHKEEVSLMITKHCIRFSMSLCPKQAKGVVGVQGQIKAHDLTLVNGKEKFRLRFDCKACEMHVMGAMRPAVIREHPIKFKAYARKEHQD